uniref:Peptidase M16 N-terminal domain-containing protein n=1 Tax=Meloidogyne javanica TaxID=6303 RepID=A0A915MHD5_MELJA
MKSESSNRIVTEASDDSGIPHMLEHCIFYGCQLHNGKGILDIASNLKVHSIDGEGLDIGVLYSEISGVERNFRRIVNNRTRKMLYGDSSVYSYNTGGLLNEIRSGCHVEKIIDFHNRYYHLDNLLNSEEAANCLIARLNESKLEGCDHVHATFIPKFAIACSPAPNALLLGNSVDELKAAEGPDPNGGPLDGAVERRGHGWWEDDSFDDFISDSVSWCGWNQKVKITDDFIKPNEGLATEEAWGTDSSEVKEEREGRVDRSEIRGVDNKKE